MSHRIKHQMIWYAIKQIKCKSYQNQKIIQNRQNKYFITENKMPAKSWRVYSEYDKKLQATPEEVRKRVARNKARRQAIKKYWKTALKWKDVDHIKPLAKWGSTSTSNTRIISTSKNRAKK